MSEMNKVKLYAVIQSFGIYEDYDTCILAIVSSIVKAQEIANSAKQIGDEYNEIIVTCFELDGDQVEFSDNENNKYSVERDMFNSKCNIILRTFDEI